MLDVLRLTQYTVVEEVELVCGPGLNVLTGETGAGKSIIVDALNLLLGARASTGVVRPGAEQAEIEAVFDLSDSPGAGTVLREHDLPLAGHELVLRRVLTRSGKSRAYANGRLVPLTVMAALREQLCDFHGQHEHQSLLQPQYQLELLDAAAGLGPDRDRMRQIVREYREQVARVEGLQAQERSKAQRIELLREDVERFEALDLGPTTEDEWRQERGRLAHAEELQALLAQVGVVLTDGSEGGPSVVEVLGQTVKSLRHAADLDSGLQPEVRTLANLQEMVEDVARSLLRYQERLEADPEALATVETKLHTLDRLKRRYGVGTTAELLALREQFTAELATLMDTERDLRQADGTLARLRDDLITCATALSQARAAAAPRLSKHVTKEIRRLGMPDGVLAITISATASEHGDLRIHDNRYKLTSTGIDRIAMTFSANAGMPPRPLREVASGGELARVMLALKAEQAGTTPLLVFDEIDAGIGGNVGLAVAEKLRGLAAARQVFCVTHLPQIAAQAATHWCVDKYKQKGRTITNVRALSGDERAREVARMFGDEAAPDTALKHAQALLSRMN